MATRARCSAVITPSGAARAAQASWPFRWEARMSARSRRKRQEGSRLKPRSATTWAFLNSSWWRSSSASLYSESADGPQPPRAINSRQSDRLRPNVAVPAAAADAITALHRTAQLDVEHQQPPGTCADEEFSQIHRPEVRDVDPMILPRQSTGQMIEIARQRAPERAALSLESAAFLGVQGQTVDLRADLLVLGVGIRKAGPGAQLREQIGGEVDLDPMARDLQALKARAERNDRRLTIFGMLGSDSHDDALAGDHVEDVETLDDHARQRPVRVVFFAEASDHMRFGALERKNIAMAETF